ncbi:uncharacterized protein LOC136074011 [Hydra vulgaris]|uniref:Uncharacterized protein LOC136074011 n=1 Tax=Hydra vulgaris TaxID=6087 RepID=A0ABM4B0S7_HYDVU
MNKDMDAIKNPTIRKRIEQGIIKAIISSKAKFGLGIETKTTQKNYQQSVKKLNVGIEQVKIKCSSTFQLNSTRKYIDVLDEMVNKYNNTKHSLIKITAVVASDKMNENIVWLNLNVNARSEYVKPKFSIGDRVRITKKKGTFEKGYTPKWNEEVLTVSQTLFSDPPTYKITDDNDEELQGTFYEQEMQKTDQNIFRIKKVIRKLKNKSLVKWYGYPESFNSWVDNKELISVKNL